MSKIHWWLIDHRWMIIYYYYYYYYYYNYDLFIDKSICGFSSSDIDKHLYIILKLKKKNRLSSSPYNTIPQVTQAQLILLLLLLYCELCQWLHTAWLTHYVHGMYEADADHHHHQHQHHQSDVVYNVMLIDIFII